MSLLTQAAVGSFTKTTSAAPVTQAVTGVGFPPVCLVLWSAGVVTAESWQAGTHWCTGIVDGTNSFCAAGSCNDGVSPTQVQRRGTAAPLLFIGPTGTVLAVCTLSSMDSDGFTVNWTTNDANAYHINYLALGGPGIQHAQAVQMVKPAANTQGVRSFVTNVGFKSDLILMVDSIVGTLDVSTGDYYPNFQVYVRGGGAFGMGCVAGNGVAADATRRGSRAGGIYVPLGGGAGATLDAGTVMDVNDSGFTTEFEVNANGTGIIFCLAIKGPSCQVVYTGRPSGLAPQTQTLKEITIQPRALLASMLIGAGFGANPGIVPARVMPIGATDGTNSRAICLSDSYAAGAQIGRGLQRSKFISMSNSSGGALDFEVDTPSLVPTPTLTWSADTADANYNPIGILAIGDANPFAGLPRSRVFTGY